MADPPPPPYTERYAGYVKFASKPAQPLAYSYAETYKHRHEVYIATIRDANKKNHQSVNALHFWPSKASSDGMPTFARIAGDVKPEDLRMVQGFQDCGTFEICGHGDELEDALPSVHAHLTRRLDKQEADIDNVAKDTASQQRESIAIKPSNLPLEHVSSGHDGEPIRNGGSLAVHAYKLHIFARYPQSLSDDPASSGETSLLFKWAKPQSVYGRLSGFWQASLVDVLDDGVFRAGGQLMIFARGVSKQQMEELRVRWREGVYANEL